MIPNRILVELAKRWPINWEPEYREATCASCGRNVHKMWHCWFKGGGFYKEIHLCKKCYKLYGDRT